MCGGKIIGKSFSTRAKANAFKNTLRAFDFIEIVKTKAGKFRVRYYAS